MKINYDKGEEVFLEMEIGSKFLHDLLKAKEEGLYPDVEVSMCSGWVDYSEASEDVLFLSSLKEYGTYKISFPGIENRYREVLKETIDKMKGK